ncbi:MAG: glycosyltransferase family 4 protein, partial [Candidatus Methanosuratus sp.]|nr:glycosyltransferase family 4 protein [Candidatus Methanosuratincola sp.]
MRLKILEVSPYFSPYVGGQEQYVRSLGRYLVKKGHQVHVITSKYPKTSSLETIDGMTVERHTVLMRLLRNPISFGYLKIGKISENFDIVHAHNEHSFSSLICALLKENSRFPLVMTNHGQLSFGDSYKDLIEKSYYVTLCKKILSRCDKIVVLSNSDRKKIISLNHKFTSKVLLVPNAIDADRLSGIESSGSVDYTPSAFTFLYVGRIIKRKGLEWLFKAIKIIKNKGEKIKLVLIGDGEDMHYFKNLSQSYSISDLIEFRGAVTNSELVYYYKNSDVFVLPSLSEGLP